MSNIDHLHSETKMLLVEDHLNHFSAQYLIHCLDTENDHITTMDHPPREMKDTLFTRHNQTVVPVLANTKKASLQAVHTSFVNTTIDNMTDNRVLNYRPPPIIDEETYLTRRQQATLSQLRSGHCKLLNAFKKRLNLLQVVQTVEWIRRMFLACSTEPLTPPLWHLKTNGTDPSRRYENWAF